MTLLELPRQTDATVIRKPGDGPITRAALTALIDSLELGNALVVMPVFPDYSAPGTLLVIDCDDTSLTDVAFTVCDTLTNSSYNSQLKPVLIGSTHTEDLVGDAASIVISGITSIFHASGITVGDYVVMTPHRIWCDPINFTYEGAIQ